MDFWQSLLVTFLLAIVFLGLFLFFSDQKDRGNLADPDAYQGCINTTGCISGVFLLGFIIILIVGIVNLFM